MLHAPPLPTGNVEEPEKGHTTYFSRPGVIRQFSAFAGALLIGSPRLLAAAFTGKILIPETRRIT